METGESKNLRLLLMGCGAVGGVVAGGLLRARHQIGLSPLPPLGRGGGRLPDPATCPGDEAAALPGLPPDHRILRSLRGKILRMLLVR